MLADMAGDMSVAPSTVQESLGPNPEIKPGNQHDIINIAVAAVATFRLFSVDGASSVYVCTETAEGNMCTVPAMYQRPW